MEYPEVKADVLGKMMDVRGTYETPFSLVQINFGSPRATVITQDAKVTFADMVGSIGGTFGVFLGISFVSLVDELVEWCLWLKQRFYGESWGHLILQGEKLSHFGEGGV